MYTVVTVVLTFFYGVPQVVHYYRTPGVVPSFTAALLKKAQAACPEASIESIATEHCFNVEVEKAK